MNWMCSDAVPAPPIAPAPEWTKTQKDAVYEFARFLQKKMGLAKPRIYIGYADEFVGEKRPVRIEPPADSKEER